MYEALLLTQEKLFNANQENAKLKAALKQIINDSEEFPHINKIAKEALNGSN